jgi:hypothetical protein
VVILGGGETVKQWESLGVSEWLQECAMALQTLATSSSKVS